MKVLALLACFAPTIFAITLRPNQRIISGGTAVVGEFPWQAAVSLLGSGSEQFCGGVLISHQHVLTAAHCARGANLFTIQIGSNLLNGPDSNRRVLSTTLITVNDDYDELTLENDLGILQFHLPVTLTAYIQPIPLETTASGITPGALVTTSGWGQDNDQTPGLVNDLKFVRLVALSAPECQVFFTNTINDATQVCAAGNDIEGICFGDTGGALTAVAANNLPVLVGVGSFFGGAGCETPAPSGFARTFPHIDWIRANIANN